MGSTCFAVKDVWNIFLKTINFVENLEVTHIIGAVGVMLFTSLWRITYENRYVTHSLQKW